MNEIDKLEFAFQNISSLLSEVEEGMYIPPRFRKLPLWQWEAQDRPRYVTYLKNELKGLRARITAMTTLVKGVPSKTLH